MPLKNESPELWHWTQAVEWIGFDNLDPVKDDIERLDFGVSSEVDSPAVERIASKAINELCQSAQRGAVEPIEAGYYGHPLAEPGLASDLFAVDFRPRTEEMMIEHVHRHSLQFRTKG